MSVNNSPGVTVGDSQARRLRTLPSLLKTRKRVLLTVLAAVIALITILTVLYVVSKKSASGPAFTTAVSDQAYSAAFGGDYAKAQRDLDAQVAKADSAAIRQQIYITQETIASNAQKYDEARKYALKAEQTLPNDSTAVLLGDIAMHMKDKTTAGKYYQLALERLNKHTPSYPNKLKSYQAKLKAARS